MGLNYIIQGQNAMTIYYNAQDRKPLVKAISEFTGAKTGITCQYTCASFVVKSL